MGAYEFTEPPEKIPETKAEFSGGPPHPPPRPPKLTARDLFDPQNSRPRIFVPDYIEVRELAALLGLKPFKVVAAVIALGIFKHADGLIHFATAAKVAQQYGVEAVPLL